MEENTEVAIEIKGLSKHYEIGKKSEGTLRGALSNILNVGKGKKERFWALKDIDLTINKGDVIGIIGKNGAGKSTLLKVLSRITHPTSGRIEINGRVASLLEVGTGFHPELTGRENIYLNGTILGMSRKEVKDKFDEIVAFSGIEKFIDTPVKHYSSGMYVRLAFAVAAHLEPEILIIDEVLAVGDAEFQKKCLGKMKDVANQGRTVLFVSHNATAVRSLCNKGLLIDKGEMVFYGNVEETLQKYLRPNKSTEKLFSPLFIKDLIEIKEISVRSKNDSDETDLIDESSEVIIQTITDLKQEVEDSYSITFQIVNDSGIILFTAGSGKEEVFLDKGLNKFELSIQKGLFTEGAYSLNLVIAKNRLVAEEVINDVLTFDVVPEPRLAGTFMGKNPGIIRPILKWKKTK